MREDCNNYSLDALILLSDASISDEELIQSLTEHPAIKPKDIGNIANMIYMVLIKFQEACSTFNPSDNQRALIRLLELLVQYQEDFLEAKHISITIHRLGKLAHEDWFPVLDQPQKDALLYLVIILPDCNPNEQAIANTFYSLGKLAEAGYILDFSQSESAQKALERLLVMLSNSKPNAQAIANTFYGLGKLAEAGYILDFSQSESAQEALECLLVILSNSEPNAQAIANTFYSLGKLPEAGCPLNFLKNKPAQQTLEILLTQLSDCKLNAQEIGNTFHGLGKLAKVNHTLDFLKNKPSQKALETLLTQLHDSKPDAQHISNTLHGLGKLAEAGVALNLLQTETTQKALEDLLTQLPKCKPNTQEIASTFHGLGKLAEIGCPLNFLKNKPAQQVLETLLTQLSDCKPNAQEIGNTFHGLGKLAKVNHALDFLKNKPPQKTLETLLTQLHDCNPHAQHISNMVHGLGKLAEAEHPLGFLQSVPAKKALKKLLVDLITCDDLDAQAISNMVYGLGKLAEGGYALDLSVSESDQEVLENLLLKLPHCKPNTQAIVNTLYGWVWLDLPLTEVIRTAFQVLFDQSKILLDISQPNKKDIQHIRQLQLAYAYYMALSKKQLIKITEHELDSYEAIYNKLTQQLERYKEKSSETHQLYLATLQSRLAKELPNQPVDIHSEVPECGYIIDITVKVGHLKLAIEINGPAHYEGNGELKHVNQVRAKHLAWRGWEVMNYDTQENRNQHDQHIKMVITRIKQAIQQLPSISFASSSTSAFLFFNSHQQKSMLNPEAEPFIPQDKQKLKI